MNRHAKTFFFIAIYCLGLFCAATHAQQPESGGIVLDESMLSSLRQISQSLERNGELDQALELLLPYREDLRVLSYIQVLCDRSGREREFLPLAVEAYERQSGNRHALIIYLHALHRAGLGDSLRAVTERFLEQGGQEREKYELIGFQLRSMGLAAEALEVFTRARKVLRNPDLFREQVSVCLIELGKQEQALTELFSYFRENRGEFATVQNQLYRILGDGAGEGGRLVVRALEKELRESGESHRNSLLRLLIDIRLTRGEDSEALKMLENLVAGVDNQIAVNQISIFIGRALKLESYEIALDAYALAERLGVLGQDKILIGRATLFERMGRYEQARDALAGITRLDPPSSFRIQAMSLLGDLCLNRLNSPDEAIEWFRRIEALDSGKESEHSEVKIKIVRSFIHLDRLDKARVLCAEILDSGMSAPEFKSEARRLLADVHFYSGSPDSAAEGYLGYARARLGELEVSDAIERAHLIRNDRSEGLAVSRLAGEALHAAATGEIQRATELFRRALESVPDSAYRTRLNFEMGKMLQRSGDYPLAVGVYREILENDPEHYLAPAVELRLGLLMLDELGDVEGARRHFENIVFNRPEGVVTPQARRLLRGLEPARL